MNRYVKSAVTAAALSLSLGTANAAVTLLANILNDPTGGGNYGGIGATAIETFSAAGGTLNDAGSLSGNYGIYNTTSPGQYTKPLGTTTGFLAVPTAGQPAPASATYQFAGNYTMFGFYLGSPDAGNSVTFLLNGVEVGGGVGTGTYALGSPGPGNISTSDNSTSSYLSFNAGGLFNQVRFTTGQVAMEVDNFAVSAIPEPGEWAMMVAGLGVVSLIARRRKSKV
jgi:hypothetical protein